MAVEIVGVDESKYKKATCNNCGSILRYTLADRKSYKDISQTMSWYIVCPKCNHSIDVG
jgi:RNase P subunit RPR2